MAWENFLFVRNRKRRCKENFFQKKKFKTAASKKNCHISFHGQKKSKSSLLIQKSLQIQRHCTVLAALLECVSFWLISGYPQWLWQHRCGQGAFPVLKPSQEPTNLCVFTKLFHSFTHSFIFFFFETGIWSCIFLVIGITWSYLFLVWSYKIYLTGFFFTKRIKDCFL